MFKLSKFSFSYLHKISARLYIHGHLVTEIILPLSEKKKFEYYIRLSHPGDMRLEHTWIYEPNIENVRMGIQYILFRFHLPRFFEHLSLDKDRKIICFPIFSTILFPDQSHNDSVNIYFISSLYVFTLFLFVLFLSRALLFFFIHLWLFWSIWSSKQFPVIKVYVVFIMIPKEAVGRSKRSHFDFY